MRSRTMGLSVIVTFGALALGACKGGPSDEELEQKFTAWQKKQTASAAPAASSDAGGDEADALYESGCLPAAAQAKAKVTAKLLVELDKLMANYKPNLPAAPDAPEKCLTKVAEINDPAGARVERLLAADHQKQVDEARQDSAQRQRFFDDVLRSLEWTWVSAIVPGHEFKLENGFLVTRPTELMSRLVMRDDLKIDTLQHCIVAQAELRGESLVLDCRGPRRTDDDFFHVEVERQAGQTGGALATVGVGDLVSFSGHLILTRRPKGARRSLRWVFQRVPADSVKIAGASTCCHGGAR